MPKVIVTAQVEDPVKREEGFRTHGDLFRSQTISAPIHFATVEGNEVICCFEPADLDTFRQILDSDATADAMDFDGIKRDTVKVFVLDKEFAL